MEVKMMEVSKLIPYDKNPRKNKKAIKVVAESIKEFGFKVPIILDKNNVIIAGHTRLQAAHEAGLTEVPVIIADELTPEQVDAFRIAENKTQEYATWDYGVLADELRALNEKEYDLGKTAFSEAEIKRLLSEKEEMPKAGIEPKYEIKLGQMFKLGEHILICGDSTKPETYERLLGKNKANLVYTDPPYGVSYSGTNNPNGRDWNVIEGDDMRGDELYNMLHLTFENLSHWTIPNPALYIFHASANQILFEKALNVNGFTIKQQLIWEKNHVLGHSHYHWAHEPIFYAAKGKLTPKFYGERNNKTFLEKLNPDTMTEKDAKQFIKQIISESTVLHVKKDNTKDYVHPTQKPVELAEIMIVNSSQAGDIVLEPFAGSGSTLLACEKRKRKCRAIELDPIYVSHIIERWEDYTQLKHEEIK